MWGRALKLGVGGLDRATSCQCSKVLCFIIAFCNLKLFVACLQIISNFYNKV